MYYKFFLNCIFLIIHRSYSKEYGVSLKDLAKAAKNPHNLMYSSNNLVLLSPVYLQFHDIQTLSIDCPPIKNPPEKIYNNSDWVYHGYKMMTESFMADFNHFQNMDPNKKEYELVINKNDQDILTYMRRCISRNLSINDRSFRNDYCSCSYGLKQPESCTVTSHYYTSAYCLDNYRAYVNSTEYCGAITKHFSKAIYSPSCSGLVTDGILRENFLLFPYDPLNTFHPDIILKDVVRQEAPVYYLAYKAIENLNYWSDAVTFCHDEPNFKPEYVSDIPYVIPHYKPIMYFHRYTSFFRMFPIAILLERIDSSVTASAFADKNYILVIREARSTNEGAAASIHRLIPSTLGTKKGSYHTGYNVLALQLYTDVFARLSNVSLDTNIKTMQFSVVGEGNLGGGAGAILISILSDALPKISHTNSNIAYNLITFDTGPVGDDLFTKDLASRVFIRNIVSKHSGNYASPCHSLHACSDKYAVWTGEDNEKIEGYVPLPGLVEFDIETLGGKWTSPSRAIEIAAQSRGCATKCWLTRKYCPGDNDEKCGDSNSKCSLFVVP